MSNERKELIVTGLTLTVLTKSPVALSNDQGYGTYTPIKKIYFDNAIKPFASVSTFTYELKRILKGEPFNWTMTPLIVKSQNTIPKETEEKNFETDVFGYLLPDKQIDRKAPLRVIPLIAINPYKNTTSLITNRGLFDLSFGRKYFEKNNSSDFCDSEFEPPLTVETLCNTISTDNYSISLNASNNTIDWLNELLKVPDFYDKLKTKKPNVKFSKDITKLDSETKGYRNKNLSDLNNEEKNNIKKLNRAILEETYPQVTPKCQSIKQMEVEKIPTTQAFATEEVHGDYYSYTITLELNRIGRIEYKDGSSKKLDMDKFEYKDEPTRKKMIEDILGALKQLSRDIKHQNPLLRPLAVAGGIFNSAKPFFWDRMKLLKNGNLNMQALANVISDYKLEDLGFCTIGIDEDEFFVDKDKDIVCKQAITNEGSNSTNKIKRPIAAINEIIDKVKNANSLKWEADKKQWKLSI